MNKGKNKTPMPYEEIHSLNIHTDHIDLLLENKISEEEFIEKTKNEIDFFININGYYRRAFFSNYKFLLLQANTIIKLFTYIKEKNPFIEKISCYSKTSTLLKVSKVTLDKIKQAGLNMIYHPIYSGNDAILSMIDLFETRKNQQKTSKKIKKSSITLAQIILIGTSSIQENSNHAKETAFHVNTMSPDYLTVSHFHMAPGKDFLPDSFHNEITFNHQNLLSELKIFIENLELKDCVLSSHNTESFLTLKGKLPEKKNYLITLIDEIIEHNLPQYLSCNLKEAL